MFNNIYLAVFKLIHRLELNVLITKMLMILNQRTTEYIFPFSDCPHIIAF